MKYFGTDGFRGRANESLTAIHAFRVGRFLGRHFARGKRPRIVLGKDTRLSSYAFEYALAAGAAASPPPPPAQPAYQAAPAATARRCMS